MLYKLYKGRFKTFLHNLLLSSIYKITLLNLFKISNFPKALIPTLLISIFFAEIAMADRVIYSGLGRLRQCDESIDTNVHPKGFDGPYSLGNPENHADMSNPYCRTIFGLQYAQFKSTLVAANLACGRGSLGSTIPNPINEAIDIILNGKKALEDLKSVCGAMNVATGTSLLTFISIVGPIYEVAKYNYEKTKICGADWFKPNPISYDRTQSFLKQDREGYVADDLEADLKNNPGLQPMDFKSYREWYYGGIEVEDNPSQGEQCLDVASTAKDGNGNYPPQRYYLKGLAAGNYNCERYNPDNPINKNLNATVEEYRQAYRCCLSRAREYVCIENDVGKTMCKAGELCRVRGKSGKDDIAGRHITYRAYYEDGERLVCAESYDLCPANFSVGGGATFCEYFKDGAYDEDKGEWIMMSEEDYPEAGEENPFCGTKSVIRDTDCKFNDKANRCMNYCQYYTHCTTSSYHQAYKSEASLPYLSRACLDFTGDSKNIQTYDGGMIGSPRHFSAPIAQCVKETIGNIFNNVAGHSKCASDTEIVRIAADGTEQCPSESYRKLPSGESFRQGNMVQTKSFFETMSNLMEDLVKGVLIISVTFFGISILAGTKDIRDKKTILTYIIKIALVVYFTIGNGIEQTKLFDGVYGVSTELTKILFKLTAEDEERKRDGCQFGEIINEDGEVNQEIITPKYPDGLGYLAVWDTLDCKIARYLSFGPNASVSNIAILIIAFFFTGPIGIYFALSILSIGIMLILTTIKAMHIFLGSCLAIMLMVFVSPITITAVLFDKTKNIFDKWLVNLISFCIQPALLFAYIFILITMMDKVLVGSACYIGDAPYKKVQCSEICMSEGKAFYKHDGDSYESCMNDLDNPDNGLIDPYDDSVACIVNFDRFGSNSGFAMIGIILTTVDYLFQGNIKERSLTLLQGALLMYLLFKFIDEIPGIASALTGGAQLPGANIKAGNVLRKGVNFASSVQKRAARGLKVGGMAAAKRAGVKADKEGDEGKSVKEDSGGESGGSHGTSSKDEGSESKDDSKSSKPSGGSSNS